MGDAAMQENALRHWMERDRVRFSNPDSIDSYASGCSKVEERGRLDLDVEYERDRCVAIIRRLGEAAMNSGGGEWPAPKTLRNCRSHVEAYAEFRADNG